MLNIFEFLVVCDNKQIYKKKYNNRLNYNIG